MPAAMRKAQDDTSRHADVGKLPRKEPDFPELRKAEEFDHEAHAERAIEAGLTPEQAIRHAKEDHKHWSPKNVEANPREE